MSPAARTVFLDRDGTLIVDKRHAFKPNEIELLDGVVDGLTLLQQAGYRLVVVTNQSGVARGFFGEDDVAAMHRRIYDVLAGKGIRIEDFYYCPHHPEGTVPKYRVKCKCRKPEPGLILQASRDGEIDLPRSWVIGDSVSDIAAGFAAGCRTVLVTHGESDALSTTFATATANDFLEAARTILSDETGAIHDYSAGLHASV